MVRGGNGDARDCGADLDVLCTPLVEGVPVLKKASAFATGANLTTAALGSGLLSLPWAGAGASVGPAVVLIVVFKFSRQSICKMQTI